jgi:tryptophan 2,3-dioxygenase
VTKAAVTYSTYLAIDELLAIQRPLSVAPDGRPEHDELLFIVIHQVYELWFKQLLHELAEVQRTLEAGDPDTTLHLLNRVLKILKTLVAQIDVLETMTPLQFTSFRDRLESASGFQSAQFREVEAVLGRRDASAPAAQPAGSAARARIEAAQGRRSVWGLFLQFVAARGHVLADDVLARDVTLPAQPDERVQDVLVALYHEDADGALVAERLVDVDEGFQEWRYRHVKMVERTIGQRVGTGGSPGTAYLLKTLNQPYFPDLWTVRSEL